MTLQAHINVKLDEDTRARLSRYMEQNDMTVSQATRLLLAVALRDEEQSPDSVFRAAAFREGVKLGVNKIRARLVAATQDAVNTALGELNAFGASE